MIESLSEHDLHFSFRLFSYRWRAEARAVIRLAPSGSLGKVDMHDVAQHSLAAIVSVMWRQVVTGMASPGDRPMPLESSVVFPHNS